MTHFTETEFAAVPLALAEAGQRKHYNFVIFSLPCLLLPTNPASMPNLISRRLVVWTIAFGCLCFLSINHCAHAQSPATEEITIVGEEVPIAYGAPPALSG